MEIERGKEVARQVFAEKRGLHAPKHQLVIEDTDHAWLIQCAPVERPTEAEGWVVVFKNRDQYLTMAPSVSRDSLLATIASMSAT